MFFYLVKQDCRYFHSDTNSYRGCQLTDIQLTGLTSSTCFLAREWEVDITKLSKGVSTQPKFRYLTLQVSFTKHLFKWLEEEIRGKKNSWRVSQIIFSPASLSSGPTRRLTSLLPLLSNHHLFNCIYTSSVGSHCNWTIKMIYKKSQS